MISIKEYKNIYKGRPVAVCGGGPSLPAHLKRLPASVVYVGVNDHLGRFVDPDYCVFLDNLRKPRNARIKEYLQKFRGIKLSNNENSDIDLDGVKYWEGGFSSSLATWFACYTGADPVILCGMDLFRGKALYFWEKEITDREQLLMTLPIENHLNAWRPALRRCVNPERIKVAGGPLSELFPTYDSLD